MVSFDIAGKRVVIIGGSSGLGYVLAREFLSARAVVTVVAEVPEIHDGRCRWAGTGEPQSMGSCATLPIERQFRAWAPL